MRYIGLMIVVLAFGCSRQSPIVGKWQHTVVDVTATRTLGVNGDYRAEIVGPRGLQITEVGTYKYDGDSLTVSVSSWNYKTKSPVQNQGAKQPWTATTKLADNDLTLVEGGETVTWHRIRA